jgi:hypothetical protein
MTFKTLLRKLQKKHYASTVAFAQALGIKDPSRLSRGQPWDVYWCLRLAQVTGEGRRLHTPEQQALLEALDAIRDPAVRKALITIARNAAGIDGGAQGGTEDGGPLIPPQTNKDPDYKMAR